VVQEALIRAYRMKRTCRTPEKPLAWMLQITRNEVFRLRSRARTTREELQPDVEASPGHDFAEDRLERVRVVNVLDSLKPRDRLLVKLRYNEDLTHAQLGRLLGISEGNVRVRLHRLRNSLKEELLAS
jgi:RNA polymerase sigma-70 factor (ECF subfamily)